MATWLEIADAYIAAAERARLAGDTAASLALALKGAQYLQVARSLERSEALLRKASQE